MRNPSRFSSPTRFTATLPGRFSVTFTCFYYDVVEEIQKRVDPKFSIECGRDGRLFAFWFVGEKDFSETINLIDRDAACSPLPADYYPSSQGM